MKTGCLDNNINETNTKWCVPLEFRITLEQSQSAVVENLARAGEGMWEEALNFLDVQKCLLSVSFFSSRRKLKASPAGQ